MRCPTCSIRDSFTPCDIIGGGKTLVQCNYCQTRFVVYVEDFDDYKEMLELIGD